MSTGIAVYEAGRHIGRGMGVPIIVASVALVALAIAFVQVLWTDHRRSRPDRPDRPGQSGRSGRHRRRSG